MDAIYVGIDVSKDKLDVHVRPGGESFVVARSGKGIDELLARLAPMSPRLVALEASGGFERVVTAGLAGAGLPVALVNPARVRAFAQSLGRLAKTDAIDAAVIAHFAEAAKPEARALPNEATQMLSDLVARRRQIVEMIVAEGQRERKTTDKRMKKSHARLKAALEKELAEIDARIDENVRDDDGWKAKEKLLRTAPGVGRVVSRTLLAEAPELGKLGGARIAALFGLAPWTRQSGKWQGKAMIGGGRAEPRAMAFMAALVAIKHNPPLKKFYEKLLARGKPKMVALIAVARRLVVILNAMLRDNRPWTQELAHARG